MAELMMVVAGVESWEQAVGDAVQVVEALRVEVVVGSFDTAGGRWLPFLWVDKAGIARRRHGVGWQRWSGGEWVGEV